MPMLIPRTRTDIIRGYEDLVILLADLAPTNWTTLERFLGFSSLSVVDPPILPSSMSDVHGPTVHDHGLISIGIGRRYWCTMWHIVPSLKNVTYHPNTCQQYTMNWSGPGCKGAFWELMIMTDSWSWQDVFSKKWAHSCPLSHGHSSIGNPLYTQECGIMQVSVVLTQPGWASTPVLILRTDIHGVWWLGDSGRLLGSTMYPA